MSDSTTLEKVRMALRITTTAFDDELTDLIEAGLADLGIAGVDGTQAVITDALTLRAVITYVRMMFGSPDEYDRLKASYDEQKAQLGMATGYTTWSDYDG